MKHNAIIINPGDNVAIALADIKTGDDAVLTDGRVIKALTDTSYSHKILLEDVPAGGDIRKYGEVIGQALHDLKAGEWVHIHNMDVEGE